MKWVWLGTFGVGKLSLAGETSGGEVVTTDCIYREGFSEKVTFKLNPCTHLISSFCNLMLQHLPTCICPTSLALDHLMTCLTHLALASCSSPLIGRNPNPEPAFNIQTSQSKGPPPNTNCFLTKPHADPMTWECPLLLGTMSHKLPFQCQLPPELLALLYLKFSVNTLYFKLALIDKKFSRHFNMNKERCTMQLFTMFSVSLIS